VVTGPSVVLRIWNAFHPSSATWQQHRMSV